VDASPQKKGERPGKNKENLPKTLGKQPAAAAGRLDPRFRSKTFTFQ